jgi:simple sugar transport system permease protein
MSDKKKKHEAPFHIVKRDDLPWFAPWLIRICAIIFALIVCGILTMCIVHINPFKFYATMIDGAFGTKRRVWSLLQNLAMLLGVSLAVTPAFKMRFWNIGAEGQVLIGGLATAACMIYFGGKVPNALLIVIMIIASIVAGAIWAFIPAVFKAKLNTNETLFTLMMLFNWCRILLCFGKAQRVLARLALSIR